jgi:hypothetical protein
MSNAEANINARLKELNNVNRIIQNTVNLINDVEIKGGHCYAVAEILGWLGGFSQSLNSQVKALEATLPKEDVKAVEPEAVKV